MLGMKEGRNLPEYCGEEPLTRKSSVALEKD